MGDRADAESVSESRRDKPPRRASELERAFAEQRRSEHRLRESEQELRERLRQLAALNAMSRRVTRRLDVQRVVEQALEGVVEQIQPDLAVLFLRHGDRLELMGARPSIERFSHPAFPVHRLGQCLCGMAARSGEPVYSHDIHDDPRCAWEECKQAGFQSFAALPLVSGNESFGVLGLAAERMRDFAAEAAFLETLANEIAAGLHNARLYEAVRRQTQELAEANEQIRRLNVELERRVAERTAELQAANEELEAFAYSVSHDLRAPLRAMDGFARALVEDCAPRLGPEGAEYCRHIVESAACLDALIKDLLAYSQLGRAPLHVQPVDLNEVIAEVMRQVESEVCERGARVRVETPLPEVAAHRGTLVQVVSNLLTNALKFVAPGTRPDVTIRAERRGAKVRLWFEDNGIGIAKEHHDRIFRPFERLHGIESYMGTGIGLAIVSRAIRRLGGRCGVESRPDAGSRFWIELPTREQTP